MLRCRDEDEDLMSCAEKEAEILRVLRRIWTGRGQQGVDLKRSEYLCPVHKSTVSSNVQHTTNAMPPRDEKTISTLNIQPFCVLRTSIPVHSLYIWELSRQFPSAVSAFNPILTPNPFTPSLMQSHTHSMPILR
jgi:hypothetical protein